jgi:hypothetical protein
MYRAKGMARVTQVHTQLVAPDATTESPGATAPGGGAPEDPEAPETASAPPSEVHALPQVALVLGIAGVILGVTVIWFFAAIPVGLVSVLVGLVARARIHRYEDPRSSSRATMGIALGCVAILLGVTGAYYLPRVMDRADNFLATIQRDVNQNVNQVNNGLTRDVDRLDRTLTRDLARFERDNHRDLKDLEDRTAATMKALEDRLQKDVDDSRTSAKRDLASLEASLRADLRTARQDMTTADSALHDWVAAIEARIERIEKQLGL